MGGRKGKATLFLSERVMELVAHLASDLWPISVPQQAFVCWRQPL